MSEKTTYRMVPTVSWRELGGHVVVLEESNAIYFDVGGSGASLWHLLIDGATPDSMADHLEENFGIDRDVAVSDVADFLDACLDASLVGTGDTDLQRQGA